MVKIFLTTIFLSFPLWVQAETDPAGVPSTHATGGQPASSATKYISDQLTIMLRTGPSNKNKIIRALSSGTELEVFESQNDFARVRTRSGLEGWVLSQHLTDKPIAKQLLDNAKEKLAQTDAKNKQLQEQIKQLRDSYNKLNEDYRILDKTKAEMEQELTHIRSVAAHPLQLSDEKNKLSLQTESLEGQVNSLTHEINKLRDNTHKQWFLTGAAVVLLGILIGLTIPKLRRQRRSDWNSI
jgi:SH3 domain protein